VPEIARTPGPVGPIDGFDAVVHLTAVGHSLGNSAAISPTTSTIIGSTASRVGQAGQSAGFVFFPPHVATARPDNLLTRRPG
jgi:hypothetical protein